MLMYNNKKSKMQYVSEFVNVVLQRVIPKRRNFEKNF